MYKVSVIHYISVTFICIHSNSTLFEMSTAFILIFFGIVIVSLIIQRSL